jgi:hypothetical protein
MRVASLRRSAWKVIAPIAEIPRVVFAAAIGGLRTSRLVAVGTAEDIAGGTADLEGYDKLRCAVRICWEAPVAAAAKVALGFRVFADSQPSSGCNAVTMSLDATIVADPFSILIRARRRNPGMLTPEMPNVPCDSVW